MQKATQLLKYASFFLVSTSIYGLAMFFAYIWLARYSVLLAYLGNLVLIIIALVWDEANLKVLDSLTESKEALLEMKKSRSIWWVLDSFISFKAALYLYYVLIMLFSRVLQSYPTLVHENLVSFINANEYSILLLIAVDLFAGQFVADRVKARAIRAKIEKAIETLPVDG